MNSQVFRLFTLSLLVSYLSLPLFSTVASDFGRTLRPSHAKLTVRRNNVTITRSLKTFHKDKKHKMKAIHRQNTQYHKKRKSHKSSQTSRCVKNSRSQKVKPKNLASEKQKYLLPQSQGFASILHVTSACGSAQPSRSITISSGPNGHESFLNCGITSGGWNPPHVTMPMIKTFSLDQEPAKSTFSACQKFRPLFEKHGQAHGIPPIFLAAFAMQESSCRPDVLGDQGGAFGLMQITKEKCGGAPGGNCADPDYNVKMGAKTFADGLAAANGNVLKAIGNYNGWTPGLTKSQALEAKDKGCCVCQQNLDYLHQFLNGWLQGIDPQIHRLGTMRNLDVCGNAE